MFEVLSITAFHSVFILCCLSAIIVPHIKSCLKNQNYFFLKFMNYKCNRHEFRITFRFYLDNLFSDNEPFFNNSEAFMHSV